MAPLPPNEPVLDYAPGSSERAELRAEIEKQAREAGYEVKVGKDTVLASFAGTILQSVDYKKKGLKWEFK